MKNIPIKKLILIIISIPFGLFLIYVFVFQKSKEVEKIVVVNKEAEFQKLLDKLDPDKEEENIKIDEYNFAQLEKVRKILDPLDKKSYTFKNLSEFNKSLNQDIKPIEGCYYVGSYNGPEKYIFGFKLESKKYISLYREIYFAYPHYSIPRDEVCFSKCIDAPFENFKYIISNPCEDTISGYVYEDANKNDIKDIGEKGVPFLIVNAKPEDGSFLKTSKQTSYDGHYMIEGIKWGMKYDIQIENLRGRENIFPHSGTYQVEFSPTNSLIGDLNFGILQK